MVKNVFAGTGISKNEDPFQAGKEAVEMATDNVKKRGGKEPNFGLIFCSREKYGNSDSTMQKFLDGVASVFSNYKDCKWLGCTTAGEISNYGASERSCVVLAVDSKYLHVGIGIGENTEKNPKESGKNAVEKALNDIKTDKYVDPYIKYLAEKKLSTTELIRAKAYSVFVLTNGFNYKRRGNEDDIIEGIQDYAGSKVTIFGGSAADDYSLKGSYVFYNGKFYKDNVICAVIGTSLDIGFDIEHGYKPKKDQTMFVNKSEGYIVKELDKKNSFDRYSELIKKQKGDIWPKKMVMKNLGPISGVFLSFAKKIGVNTMNISPLVEINCNTPLAVADLKGRYWIKGVDSIVDNNYLMFTEKVPENTLLYLMETDKNLTVEATRNSITNAMKEVKNKASFLIVIDCALHRWFMGADTKKNLDLVKDIVKDVPMIGFYSYGELLDGRHSISIASMAVGENLIVSK
jgi:hypothetical protein